MASKDSTADKSHQPAPVPILLGNAGYYGTLAAIRSLGRAGVPVICIDPSSLSPGQYSRFSAGHLRSPPCEQTKRWVEWLLNTVATQFAGSVLYATSDAVSYALAKFRDELSARFQLLQPDLETTMSVLDKGRLLNHARAVGIDTPETWLPRSREEVRQIANDVSECLIVKPRCQLAVGNCAKGSLVRRSASTLLKKFDQVVAVGPHDPDFARCYPDVMSPMLQVYYPETTDRVFSLTGFRDRSGARTAVLGALKVMQRPRYLGVGVCFEEAPVDPALAAKVFSLCERIGYYGAFEAEFIPTNGRFLLIDFNARFYNQIGLDIARGLDLPGLVHAAASGQDKKVDSLLSAFERRNLSQHYSFCNTFQFKLVTRVRRTLGTMSRQEANRWSQWFALPGRILIDATYDGDDYLPYLVDAVGQTYLNLRYIRGFLKDCREK